MVAKRNKRKFAKVPKKKKVYQLNTSVGQKILLRENVRYFALGDYINKENLQNP